jgi:hypothetical protein
MLDEMPATVWQEWQAFLAVEPGEIWAEIRTARLMALLANIHRDPKRKAYSPRDFWMVEGADSGAQMSGEALRQTMLTWAMAHNATQRARESH